MFMQVFAIAMFAIAVAAVLFFGGWMCMETRQKKHDLMDRISKWLDRQEGKDG